MKNVKKDGIEAKISNQSANEDDFISSDKKLKVNVNLYPSEENPQFDNSYMFYVHVIDMQITDGELFHTVLFGQEEDERVFRGIWNVAIVTINDIPMLVPFNIIDGDNGKSMLFNPYTNESFVFTNVQAVLTMASFMYSIINFYSEDSSNFKKYVEYTSGDFDIDAFHYILKSFVYEQDDDKMNSFKLLD